MPRKKTTAGDKPPAPKHVPPAPGSLTCPRCGSSHKRSDQPGPLTHTVCHPCRTTAAAHVAQPVAAPSPESSPPKE